MSRIRDIANILTSSTAMSTDAEVTAAISAHNSSTTTVHGISDTSALATSTSVSSAISTHNTAANGHVGRGTTGNRPASPTVGDFYFDTTILALIVYKSTGWERASQDPAPGIVSISPTTAATTGTLVTITGSSFKPGLAVQFIGTDSSVYNSPVVTFVDSLSATATTPQLPVAFEPYDVKVLNSDNQFGVLENCLDSGGTPVWNTSSGNIVSLVELSSLNTSVSAADPDGTSIVYSSSNLPAWVTLNSSSGALTGTAPDVASDTTYTFDITASDGVNSSSRSFNIVVNNAAITGGNEINTVGSYKYHIFTANGTFATNVSKTVSICSIGGGGGGGAYTAGGGGAGELDLFTNFTLTPGNHTVLIGGPGSGSNAGNVSGGSGGTTTFTNPSSTVLVTSLGGGGGGSQGTGAGVAGGSGGGGEGVAPSSGGAANGSNTRAGGTGGNGGGFYGGGGGGGATTAGGNYSSGQAGAGGQGYTLTNIDTNLTSSNFSSFAGMTVVCSGGGGAGGGGGSTGPSAAGAGGTGAGAGGASNDAGTGTRTSGQVATSYGSGGGGGGSRGDTNPGAAGKSGLLIVRYAI